MQEIRRIPEISNEEKDDIKKNLLLGLFNEKKVRKALFNDQEYFSVVDAIGVFLFEKDHKKAKNHWNTLKNRARKEEHEDGFENQLVENKKHENRQRRSAPRSLVFIFNQLKKHVSLVDMRATDGKCYTTEAIPADSFLLLLKTLSAVKGERMRLWLQRELRLAQLRESGKPTCRSNF